MYPTLKFTPVLSSIRLTGRSYTYLAETLGMNLSQVHKNYANEKNETIRGAWLAQWEEHVTLGLWVMSLSPTLGTEIT